MKCINFRVRTENYQKYIYCIHFKKKIKIDKCKDCKFKEYKQFRELKKQSSKQRKLETNRFSMLTDNLEVCYICDKRKKYEM